MINPRSRYGLAATAAATTPRTIFTKCSVIFTRTSHGI
jgi:hypothetical protein